MQRRAVSLRSLLQQSAPPRAAPTLLSAAWRAVGSPGTSPTLSTRWRGPDSTGLSRILAGVKETVSFPDSALRVQTRSTASLSSKAPAPGAIGTEAVDALLHELGRDGDEEENASEARQTTVAGAASRRTPSDKKKARNGAQRPSGKKRKTKKPSPRVPARDGAHEAGGQSRATRPLAATEPDVVPIADARRLFVDAGGVVEEDAGPPPRPTTATGSSGMGWSYEAVDPTTGKTQLEVLYESNQERIQRILEQPLPPLPQDGHVNPDFFVGFGHYDYRLRDEYRAILARELQIPVKAVKLSVAWGGRFDVSRFNRVRKVCGVCIDPNLLPAATAAAKGSGADGAGATQHLPETLQRRIVSLVEEINSRRSERLLQSQLLQASGAIPEVEFAYTHRQHRLLVRLHEWLRAHVLQQSLAVIVVGGNQVFREWRQTLHAKHQQQQQQQQQGQTDANHVKEGDPSRTTAAFVCQSFSRNAAETRQQRAFVEDVWLKPFHSRHIIPRRVSVGEVATTAARAVLQNGIPHLTAVSTSEGGESLLPESIQSLFRSCATSLEATPTAAAEGTGTQSIFETEEHWRDQPAEMQEAALQWLHITREALFLGVQQQQQQQQQQHVSAVHGSASPSTTHDGEQTADEGDGVYKRRRQFTGDMPALFLHGAYAGGLREMRYLQSNRAAMDALLLHPNDITMKRAFASRMRNGHQRLRMHEELAASEQSG